MIPGLILALVLNLQGLVDQMAQDHADRLATATSLYHSDISPLLDWYGGPCEWAGEVIYAGSDPAARWDAYAASPSHSQVVNTPRTYHGVGVATHLAGQYLVVDIFCRVSAPTTTPPRSPPTNPPTTVPTTTPTTAPSSILTTKSPPLCPSRWICVQ